MSMATVKHPRLLTVSAVVLALGLLPVIAGAAVLLNEQFNYPNGNLVGNDSWANHSGTGFFIQVSGGQAILLQGSGSREDANAPFAARGAGDMTYVAIKVTVPSASVFGTGDYFAHFRSATFVYPARIYITAPQAGGNFTFGISGTSVGTTPIVYWGSDFSFGSTHTIVAAYNAADGSARMWVDPASEGSTSVVSTGGAIGDLISSYALRQGSITTSEQDIAGFIVGTTFDDVMGAVVPVESATWGGVKDLYR